MEPCELVVEVVKRQGAKHLRLALAAAASIDGGLGFLQAMGATFKSKTPLPPRERPESIFPRSLPSTLIRSNSY